MQRSIWKFNGSKLAHLNQMGREAQLRRCLYAAEGAVKFWHLACSALPLTETPHIANAISESNEGLFMASVMGVRYTELCMITNTSTVCSSLT